MARLSAKTRKSMPKSSFAGPGKSYPDNDINHARMALSMAAKYASPAERAKIDAKVHRDWPSIGKGGHKTPAHHAAAMTAKKR